MLFELLSGRIAKLAEHPAEKPGAILMRVQVPIAARDFSPIVNFQCRLSYGVRTAHCAIARISIRAHMLKLLNTDSRITVWTHENTTHTDRNG